VRSELPNQPFSMRLLAFACLAALLVASLAAPIHKHTASQDSSCLICHATTRADVVRIANDPGKPLIASTHQVAFSPSMAPADDISGSVRSPRAPPSKLFV
jgi:hypothetical protein